VLAAVGIGVLVSSLDRVDRFAAVATGALLATSPSLIELTRVDVGPSAIEFLLRCLGLAIVIQWAGRRPTTRGSIALAAIFVVGTFNKLNFVWTVGALLVAVAVVAPELRRQRREATIVLVGAAAAAAMNVRSLIVYGQQPGVRFPSLAGIGQRIGTMRSTLDGSWFRRWTTTDGAPWLRSVVLVALVVVAVVSIGALRHGKHLRLVAALAAGLATGAVLWLATEGAVRGWHALVVLPLVPLVLTLPAVELDGRTRRWHRAAIAALVAAQVAMVVTLTASRDRDLTPVYTTATYDLAKATEAESQPVLLTDWGMKSYLQAVDHRPGAYVETFWMAPPALCHNLVVVRSEGFEFFPGTRAAGLSIAPMHREATLTEKGRPVFDLYRIDQCGT